MGLFDFFTHGGTVDNSLASYNLAKKRGASKLELDALKQKADREKARWKSNGFKCETRSDGSRNWYKPK